MNSQHLTSTYYDLTHGWHGFVVMYVLIAIFSLAGLKRSRANPEAYVFWPFTSLPTMVIVGLGLELFSWILSFFVKPPEMAMDLLAVLFMMGGGFLGGVYWASKGKPLVSFPIRCPQAIACAAWSFVYCGCRRP